MFERGVRMDHYGHQRQPDDCCGHFLKATLFFSTIFQLLSITYELYATIVSNFDTFTETCYLVFYAVLIALSITQLIGIVREQQSILLSASVVHLIAFICLLAEGHAMISFMSCMITICFIWFTIIVRKRDNITQL